MEKKINIGVNKQEYDSAMRSISGEAKRVVSEMVRSAREQENSSNNALRSIKEQISLLKEKQRIMRDMERSELSSQFGRGEISEGKFRSGSAVIEARTQRDERLIKEVKNVVDAIKSTSKEEIREDRKSAEQRINLLRKTSGVARTSDELENLRQLTQDAELKSRIVKNQMSGLNPFAAYGMGEGVGAGQVPMGLINAIGGAKLWSLLSGGVGVAAGGIAALGGAALKGQDVSMESVRNLLKIDGGGNSALAKIMVENRVLEGSFANMGINPLESFNLESGLTRSRGGRLLNYNDLVSSIALTRSRDISQSQLEGMYSVGRYSSGSSNPTLTAGNFEAFLKGIQRPIGQLPELIDQYLQISNQIMMSQGSVNAQSVQNLVGGIVGSYGVEGVNIGRYTQAATFLGSRQNRVAGMSHLQIRAARKVLGNQVSLLEIDKLRDNPSHPKFQEYYRELSNELMGMRGGGEGAVRVLEQAYGGKLGLTELDKMVREGQRYVPTQVTGGEDFISVYKTNAETMTSDLQEWKKELSGYLTTIANKIDDVIRGQR